MFRVLTAAVLLSTAAAPGLSDDLPSGVVNTQNANDVSLSPEESLKRITVPDGFHVTLFAGEPDLRRPIAFDFDDRGRLWVVENYSHPVWKKDAASDRIIILEDTDHDGRFDRRKVFWDKGRYLTAIAIGHGGVWIGNTPDLAFIPDRDSDDQPDGDPIVMLDGFQISTNNVLNNFHWGPDGWLYGAIGLSTKSLVGSPGSPNDQRVGITRGIWRFHPIRHEFEKVAEGMVNPWGADFNEFGDLITSNTVLAHLWHIVPGMYCERRANERDNSYAYARIQSITDHLHWGGGTWQNSREHSDQHSVAGGGHAHCGAMIYLGDNWPKKYRGAFFTNNLHGNRVNSDKLTPKGSSYVGVHADDFLFGNDPWFRGMSIKYGPDGGVYISDWHDIGECHDSDGSHRSSGRIYKVVYGKPDKPLSDLQSASSSDLAGLHEHPNEWYVRHARRILQERAEDPKEMPAAVRRLRKLFSGSRDEGVTLRAMWTLFVIGAFDQAELVALLDHKSLHVRRWAVRFLVDQESPGPKSLNTMARVAQHDVSPKVRLALAVALQRMQPVSRWPIAQSLAAHDDSLDDYLPLMLWYGIEPLVASDHEAALQLAVATKMPQLRRFIVRRIVDSGEAPLEDVVRASLKGGVAGVRLDLLHGMLDALDGRGNQVEPDSWKKLYRQVSSSDDPMLRSIAVRLAVIFGDRQAIAQLRKTALDQDASIDDRRDSFRALVTLDDGASVAMLHELAGEPSVLRREAIEALTLRNKPATAGVLLQSYSSMQPTERQAAIGVLVTRRSFAETLMTAIEENVVRQREVSAFALQQLRAFKDDKLNQRIAAIWADDSRQFVKSDEIARFKKQMTPDYLSDGDIAAGRRMFERTCAKCHTLFGEGGNIGPDLTGSGRRKVDYVLSNLIDPSAIIDPAYRLTQVLTTDGRLLSGFIVQQDDRRMTLRTQEARIRLDMKNVDELFTSDTSMMPEGMLRSFSDEQIRDLLVYLASPGQIPLPQSASE